MSYIPKVSIIIPVYNTERYLCRCLDSVLGQTFTEFELLLIDDGSSDGSGLICEEYAKKDMRIRVFHKKNNGVACARQWGMDYVRGEYFIHVDSDDWIESNMLERMLGVAEEKQAEIVITDFFVDRKDGKRIYKKQRPSLLCVNILLQEMLNGKLIGTLWNKLIRTDLWKTHNVCFVDNINYCEDVLALAQLLQHSARIFYLPHAFYHYCDENSESITRNYTIDTYVQRKKYISALNGIVAESSLVQTAALGVKIEAFRHELLSVEDFYYYYPVSCKVILANKIGGKSITFLFMLGKCGLFSFAKVIWNLRKKLNKLCVKLYDY